MNLKRKTFAAKAAGLPVSVPHPEQRGKGGQLVCAGESVSDQQAVFKWSE